MTVNRSTLSADLGRREATAVAERLVGELQRGFVGRDAEVYNRSFAGDVRWGTPFGEIVVGYERLHAIHREMLPAGVGGVSRYEIVGVDAPAPQSSWPTCAASAWSRRPARASTRWPSTS